MLATIGPYPASRHLIPKIEPETVTQVSRFFGNGTTTTTTTTTSSMLKAGGGASGSDQALFMVASIVALLLIIALLVQALRSPVVARGRSLWRPAATGDFTGRVFLLGYRYPGLKGEVRRLIEAMVSIVSRAGVRVSPGMTVREIADRARELGFEWALEASRLYYEAVFSRRQPSLGLVERLRRLVKG